MKVTPVGKKFGKYQPGDVFEFPDKAAKLFIKVGKLQAAAEVAPTYQTRMLTAEPVAAPVYTRSEPVEAAPYGYKADGTPRQRPGRPAKAD